MAGGGFVSTVPERAELYQGRLTVYVVVACLVAAVGGSLFGYDIGISGGVTSMEPFLEKFFPEVARRNKSKSSRDSNYCKYDNQRLALFTSSLYLAGLFASLAASPVTRRYGRRASIIVGGASFLVGATLNAAAANLPMLFLGRALLGVGIGFGNQAVPLYLSEMAPPRARGGLNMLFQLATTTGNFVANLVNYGTQRLPGHWGWRLSLGLAGVPALVMLLGGLGLPETPNSLAERGHLRQARSMLQRIRGTADVDAEFQDLVEASQQAASVRHPFRNILRRRNRPQLVMAFCLPTSQILTGINIILFYAPVLFRSLGFRGDAPLYSSVVTGAVLVGATVLSIFSVDRLGRRFFLLLGGVQMVACQVAAGAILAFKFGAESTLSGAFSALLVAFICLFVLGFGISWGPLGWTIPSEIFPLETRSAGQAITVAVNLFFTFAIAQAFLSILCAFRYGTFFFFAGWICVMTVFVYFLLPETKGVPIEEMISVWAKHWFWKRYVVAVHDEKPTKTQQQEEEEEETHKNNVNNVHPV